jgi:hypothetical protein
MLSFDYVYLGQLSPSAQYGIKKFFEDYMEQDYPGSYIPIDQFCFLIELLKNLEEKEDSEYFPSGKWATIQVMQNIRDEEIKKQWTSKES